jgi:uncharacterized protein (TIGR03118 family)
VISHRLRPSRPAALVAAAAAGLVLAAPAAAFASPGHAHVGDPSYHNSDPGLTLNQVNLFADKPGAAGQTDADLINPWGAAFTPDSGLWVAEQGTDSAEAFTLAPGSSTATQVPVHVSLPGSVLPVGGPAGLVANTGTGFDLSDGKPAEFIFDTLDGHIEAWNQDDGLTGNAEDEVTIPGAGYTGLAIATTKHGDELFAADFRTGAVDVFDSEFRQVKLAAWQFRDPRQPEGYVPFNTQTLDGNVFVTYDEPDPTTHREGVGEGDGIVDEFSSDGRFIARIATGGPLSAPWGLAIAPGSWGSAVGSLLIGNFGDGRINIFAKDGDRFARHATGQVLVKSTGEPFAEPGLWSLLPGGTAKTGASGALWFTAGTNGEQDGLLGVLRP